MRRTTASFTCVGPSAAIIALSGFLVSVSGQASRTTAVSASVTLIDDLVTGNRILAEERIVDGPGHISVRSNQRSDRFLLARDIAPGLVTAADIVEYDLDANPVSPNAPRGYQERFIHSAIYRARPDVGAIVHAHTPSVVAFSVSEAPLRPMYHVAAFLLPGVPVYEIRKTAGHEGMLVNDVRTGEALAAALRDKAVVLMRGHGYAVVAPDVPEAVSRSLNLDANAQVQAQAIALGRPITYLSNADATAAGPPVAPNGPNTRGAGRTGRPA